MSYAFIGSDGTLMVRCSAAPQENREEDYRLSYKASYVTSNNYGIKFFRRKGCTGKLWSESNKGCTGELWLEGNNGRYFKQNIEVIGTEVKMVLKTVEEIEYYIGAEDVPQKKKKNPQSVSCLVSDGNFFRKQKDWLIKVGKFFRKQAKSICSFFVYLKKKITKKRSSDNKGGN